VVLGEFDCLKGTFLRHLMFLGVMVDI